MRLSHALSNLYGFVNLKLIFQNTCRITSFSPTKMVSVDLKNPKLFSKPVVGIAMTFTLVKGNVICLTGKRVTFPGNIYTSAVADHTIKTGHNIKWDHFEVLSLANGRSDLHCKVQESSLIRELN